MFSPTEPLSTENFRLSRLHFNILANKQKYFDGILHHPAALHVMNPPMSVPPPLWQEAKNTDGRVYYYNVQTKATQWNKPFELMTPVEVRKADSALSWRTVY